MNFFGFVEWVLWVAAALAAGGAFAAHRFDAGGVGRKLGWLGFALFIAAALGWMFGDTYAYYYGQKRDELRVSYWGSYREHEMWGDLVAAFARVHPEIQVKREYITTRYEEKIQQLLLADEAPDIILFQDEPMPRFISSGKFAVLDEYLERPGFSLELEGSYWETAVVSFQQQGRTYAIPIWGGNCLIIYNRATFREAGVAEPPPQWSVEEFIETCRRISADSDGDGRMERYGFLVPGWVYWLPFHYAFGATYLDERRTRWTLWGTAAEASFELWRGLRHSYHVAPHRDELTETGSVAFMTGRVAMFISGPWAMPPLNEAGVDYDIAHIPRGPGGQGTRVTWDGLALFAGSQKKEEAWKFIHFATSLPGQEIVARYQRSVPALKAGQEAFVEGNGAVRAERFIEAMDYARFQPITLHWNLMDREVASETDLLLDDRQSTRQTLLRLARNPHLGRHFSMPVAGQP